MEHSLDNIERFILGQMTLQEAEDFQLQIDHDKELDKKVEKMRLIIDAMELEVENALRAHLDELQKKRSNSPKLKRPVQWVIAATLLLMLGASIWFFSRSRPTLEHFVEKHYSSYSAIDLRSESETKDLSEGLELLQQSSELEAIQWFRGFIDTHPEDFESRFILADLLQKTGQHLAARDQFRVIGHAKSILWKEKANWNDILLSAQYDWDTRAKESLERVIADKSNSYHDLAIDLADKFTYKK